MTTVKIRNIVRLYLHDEHGLMGVELDHVIVVLDDGTVCALSDDVLDLAFTLSFFINGPSPAPFSFIFGLFIQISIQFLQQINVKNIHPVYGSGI